MPDVLDRRALNRALLARQFLLGRAPLGAEDAMRHLVGMQSQVPLSPYVGLWSRLADFRAEELAGLVEERKVVRLALMRSTVHAVTADDCLGVRPLVQPAIERSHGPNWGKYLTGVDQRKVAEAGRVLVDAEPLTFAALGAALAERWPKYDPQALAMAVRTYVALVQPPPRGVWGRSGAARHTSAENWLGRPLSPDAIEDVVVRYLAAFGPASVQDFQTWSGITRLAPVLERLRPELATFEDENGVDLFDLPDAPRPSPETPAPPRFLPEYDNALLSHADRTRIVTKEQSRRIFTRGALLVDGFVHGAWRIRKGELELELFERLSRAETKAVKDEGERLVEFARS